jgi:hypothetical protein
VTYPLSTEPIVDRDVTPPPPAWRGRSGEAGGAPHGERAMGAEPTRDDGEGVAAPVLADPVLPRDAAAGVVSVELRRVPAANPSVVLPSDVRDGPRAAGA